MTIDRSFYCAYCGKQNYVLGDPVLVPDPPSQYPKISAPNKHRIIQVSGPGSHYSCSHPKHRCWIRGDVWSILAYGLMQSGFYKWLLCDFCIKAGYFEDHPTHNGHTCVDGRYPQAILDGYTADGYDFYGGYQPQNVELINWGAWIKMVEAVNELISALNRDAGKQRYAAKFISNQGFMNKIREMGFKVPSNVVEYEGCGADAHDDHWHYGLTGN